MPRSTGSRTPRSSESGTPRLRRKFSSTVHDRLHNIAPRVVETQATPGPGEYEPRRSKSTNTILAGSAAFRSSSAQRKNTFEWSDPGTFVRRVGNLKHSFNRSVQEGDGKFGSKSPRPAWGRVHPVHHAGPIPGTYNPREPWRYGKNKPSAGFLTTTKRSEFILKVAKKNIPDPYLGHSTVRSQQKRVVGGESSFKGTPRFEVQRTGQGDLGPGSYRHDHNTMSQSARDYKSGPSKLSACFAGNRHHDLFQTPKVRATERGKEEAEYKAYTRTIVQTV